MNKKSIIILLIIIFITGLCYLVLNNSKQDKVINNSLSDLPQNSITKIVEPQIVVEQFYKQYLNDSDLQIKPKFDFHSKEYLNQQPMTKIFQEKIIKLFLDENQDFDPIICGQDNLDFSKFQFSVLNKSATNSEINVVEFFEKPITWKVNLILDENQWKIEGIDCPK